MPIFYFRNDDVNVLDDQLIAVTKRCTEEGVPITHTVEPANVTDECADWLLKEKSNDPRLLEIMQHGYDHVWRDLGEFGGKRPFDDQMKDLQAGKSILLDKFGSNFLPCLNFPFGPYNSHSMRAADQLGFRMINSHYNCRISRRIMYAIGHALRLGQIKGKHVSYHLDFYPRTGMFCIDMAVSFISKYIGEHGSTTCEFHSAQTMIGNATKFIDHTPVIGVLLHHRFHHTPESLDLITDVIKGLKKVPDAQFLNIEEIYQQYAPDPGLGFRNG